MTLNRMTQLGICFCLFLTSINTNGQTVTAISNGNWTDAAVWDCNCVPGPTNDVVIGSALTISTQGAITVQSLTINSLAVFTVGFGEFTVTGSMFIAGAINNTFIVHVNGDLTNSGSLSGGSYCVAGITTNTGGMLGQMDFCDLTPPPNSPFVDNNTGTIDAGVKFCQNGICIPTSIETESASENGNIEVLALGGEIRVTLRDIEENKLQMELVDLQGKLVWKKQVVNGSNSIELSPELNGLYLYRISSSARIFDQGKILIK